MRGQETRKKIIQAAKKLFGSRSYDSVSMDMIAQRAGVSKGLLYLYFESKVDLFTSVFEDNIKLFETLIENIIEIHAPIEKKLGILLDSVETHIKANKFFPFFPASKDFSPEVHKAIGKKILPRIENIKRKITEIFESGIKAGEIASYSSQELALVFLGMLFALIQDKKFLPTVKPHIIEILFNGIKRGKGELC